MAQEANPTKGADSKVSEYVMWKDWVLNEKESTVCSKAIRTCTPFSYALSALANSEKAFEAKLAKVMKRKNAGVLRAILGSTHQKAVNPTNFTDTVNIPLARNKFIDFYKNINQELKTEDSNRLGGLTLIFPNTLNVLRHPIYIFPGLTYKVQMKVKHVSGSKDILIDLGDGSPQNLVKHLKNKEITSINLNLVAGTTGTWLDIATQSRPAEIEIYKITLTPVPTPVTIIDIPLTSNKFIDHNKNIEKNLVKLGSNPKGGLSLSFPPSGEDNVLRHPVDVIPGKIYNVHLKLKHVSGLKWISVNIGNGVSQNLGGNLETNELTELQFSLDAGAAGRWLNISSAVTRQQRTRGLLAAVPPLVVEIYAISLSLNIERSILAETVGRALRN